MGLNKSKLKSYATGSILVPLINRYQQKGEFPEAWNIEIRNHKPSDPHFHPSGDCLMHPKELYEKMLGLKESEKTSWALRRVFDAGHFWHGYYQEILVAMGVTKSEWVEIGTVFEHPEYGFTAKGTADVIVEIPGKGKYLVDMKTVNDNEFDNGIRPETLSKWTAQVNCYMDWFDIHRAFILAIRKGGTPGPGGKPMHDLKEIPIKYETGLLDDIYRRWDVVWRSVKSETPPSEEDIDSVYPPVVY